MVQRILSAAFVAVVSFGCGTALPTEERVVPIQPVYELSRSDVPSPNNLAVADGKVAINANDALSEAENELKLGFNGLDGFSLGSSARVRFTAALDANTLNAETVVVLDLGKGGKGSPQVVPVRYEFLDCDQSLTVIPTAGYQRDHHYLVAVKAGEAGPRGLQGEKLAAPAAFHFLRAGKDLREHPAAIPGATREERAATAIRLENIRSQLIEPALKVLEGRGVSREEVAVVWTFQTTTRGELYFDTGSKRLPFPNDLLKDPHTGLVSLPIDPADKPDVQALRRGFNKLDGFGLTSMFTIDATTELDRVTVKGSTVATLAGDAGTRLTPGTVRVFRRDTLEELTDLKVTLTGDNRRILVEPLSPLRPATSYVVVTSGVRDSQHNLLEPMPLASLLKLTHPLSDSEGNSAISSLCNDSAFKVEKIRAELQPFFEKLEQKGVKRKDVSLAYTFTTQDIIKRFRELHAVPYEKNLPLAVYGGKDGEQVQNESALGYLAAFALVAESNDIARVVHGRINTFEYLDPVTRAFRENGEGEVKKIHFVLTIPKGITPGAKIPVVVFGHGLMTWRGLGMMVADKLAERGMAMMAIDLPYHGERSVCLIKPPDFNFDAMTLKKSFLTHCPSDATCGADGRCIDDGSGEVVPLSRTVGYPHSTGDAFIDVHNLFGQRDHFRQSIIDLSAQTRMIRKFDWKKVTKYSDDEGIGLDGNQIHYAGISLGGIMGGIVGATDPYLDRMLLNVGGGNLVDLIRESATFKPSLENDLLERDIDANQPQSPEFLQFINAARWALDEVDPQNLARYASHEVLDVRDYDSGGLVKGKAKRLRLHMATGDSVVPNSATQVLLRATRVDPDTQYREFPLASHGFLCDPFEAIQYNNGLDDMADFLDGTIP